jgi:hypothetical protein
MAWPMSQAAFLMMPNGYRSMSNFFQPLLSAWENSNLMMPSAQLAFEETLSVPGDLPNLAFHAQTSAISELTSPTLEKPLVRACLAGTLSRKLTHSWLSRFAAQLVPASSVGFCEIEFADVVRLVAFQDTLSDH